MARRATLTQETLVALGVDKLARPILDEVHHNALFKRIVTAALADAKGPDAVAAIIDRRLASLERARGQISWDYGQAWNMPCAPTPREILALGAAALGVRLRMTTIPLRSLPL